MSGDKVGNAEAMQTIVDEMAAEREIRRLLAAYCRGVDRQDFPLMRSTYHDDAYDDHGPYKGGPDGLIEWVAERQQRVEQTMHFLGNSLVDVSGDVAVGETYCIVFQRMRRPGEEAPTRMTVGCRYVDRFERRNGTWRIARRVVVHEWWRETDCEHDVELAPPLAVGVRSSDDPIFAFLREMRTDEPGDVRFT